MYFLRNKYTEAVTVLILMKQYYCNIYNIWVSCLNLLYFTDFYKNKYSLIRKAVCACYGAGFWFLRSLIPLRIDCFLSKRVGLSMGGMPSSR